jgi:hypothetical protein
MPDDAWRQRGGDQHGLDVRVQPGVRGVRRASLLRADGVQVQVNALLVEHVEQI